MGRKRDIWGKATGRRGPSRASAEAGPPQVARRAECALGPAGIKGRLGPAGVISTRDSLLYTSLSPRSSEAVVKMEGIPGDLMLSLEEGEIPATPPLDGEHLDLDDLFSGLESQYAFNG